MSCARRLSRSGCAATSCSSSASTPSCRPSEGRPRCGSRGRPAGARRAARASCPSELFGREIREASPRQSSSARACRALGRAEDCRQRAPRRPSANSRSKRSASSSPVLDHEQVARRFRHDRLVPERPAHLRHVDPQDARRGCGPLRPTPPRPAHRPGATSPARRRSAASSVRGRRAVSSAGRPPTSTSMGPSTRNSTTSAFRIRPASRL